MPTLTDPRLHVSLHVAAALALLMVWPFLDGPPVAAAVPGATGLALLLAVLPREEAKEPLFRLRLACGMLVAASPWIAGFDGTVWAPHLHLGQLVIGVTIATRWFEEGEAWTLALPPAAAVGILRTGA